MPNVKEEDDDDEREDPLEFLLQHQQDRLMYSRLRLQLEDRYAYLGSVCTGLCVGSILALFIRLLIAIARMLWILVRYLD